jgi:hypothetical protein
MVSDFLTIFIPAPTANPARGPPTKPNNVDTPPPIRPEASTSDGPPFSLNISFIVFPIMEAAVFFSF